MTAAGTRYDAIIVGSGFGGAMAAHVLVRAGWRVLLLERGGLPVRDEGDWDPHEVLVRQRYRSPSPVLVQQNGARRPIRVFPNEVVGGNSVFYGGASLRLRQADFARWPISYEELEPYYTRAENLLGVHGEEGQDPCEPPRSAGYPARPVPLNPPAQRIHRAAVQLGLHPFPIPLALNFSDPTRPTCIQCSTCDGFPCRIEAKND
ncbi:MAG: NAD(P)-binding protein, partial [Candidatus Latescibacterota bacterium]